MAWYISLDLVGGLWSVDDVLDKVVGWFKIAGAHSVYFTDRWDGSMDGSMFDLDKTDHLEQVLRFISTRKIDKWSAIRIFQLKNRNWSLMLWYECMWPPNLPWHPFVRIWSTNIAKYTFDRFEDGPLFCSAIEQNWNIIELIRGYHMNL